MYMVPFSRYFPELAHDECRYMVIGIPDNDGGIVGEPHGGLGFSEAYCSDPECDCRRVLITAFDVIDHSTVATISFGFDKDGPFPGPFLDPMCKQSSRASEALKAFRIVIKDKQYVERLERHYQMFKEAVEEKQQAGVPRKLLVEKRLSPEEARVRIDQIKADRKRQRRAEKRAAKNRQRRPK